jgi:hypothetical protein
MERYRKAIAPSVGALLIMNLSVALGIEFRPGLRGGRLLVIEGLLTASASGGCRTEQPVAPSRAA